MRKDFVHGVGRYETWREVITDTHRRQIQVRVLNLEHRPLRDLTPAFYSGDVTIDTRRDPTRVLTVALFDPFETIRWEPDDYGSGTSHLSRMFQVHYAVTGPGLDGWAECPVFTGPVQPAGVDRDGPFLNIVCGGKEALALGELGRVKTFSRKAKVTDIIRWLMRETGEVPSRMRIPDLPDRIPERLTLNRMDKPWIEATKLARSIGRVLFYDGSGVLILRKRGKSPAITLGRRELASNIGINREPQEWHNRWIALGPKPRGDKKRVIVDLRLDKKHEMSAHAIGRNGEPRWRIWREEDSKFKNRKKALNACRERRDDQALMVAETGAQSLPIPNVEEYDMVRFRDPLLGVMLHRVQSVTIPLTLEGAPTQSWGSLKRIGDNRGGRGQGFDPATHGGL